MFAGISAAVAAPVGAYELIKYAPTGNSRLIGGTISVSLRGDGFGYDASGTAVAYTPAYVYDAANVFFQCSSGLPPCFDETYDFTGALELPVGRGGSLILAAGCGGSAGESCDQGGSEGAWSLVRLYSATLVLENDATPTASGFAGSLLEPDAHGTADLRLTASDPGGPGVSSVRIAIDGESVYDAVPDGNDGHCVAVGSYQGAEVFDYQSPCKESETVQIPVDTTRLADGQHTLTVTVTDAAGNSSVAYSGTITTANRTSVSALLDSPGDTTGLVSPRYAIVLSSRSARLVKHLVRSFLASAVRLSGRVLNSAGMPVPGVTVWLASTEVEPGSKRVLAQTTTNASGAWSLRAGKGPSRQLQVGYSSSAGSAAVGESTTVAEVVRPSLGLRVASRGGGRIVFSGRLQIHPLGNPTPLVSIQTRGPAGWETVGVPIRVQRNGNYNYSFPSSPITYGRRFAFRATTPKTSLWSSASSPIRETVIR